MINCGDILDDILDGSDSWAAESAAILADPYGKHDEYYNSAT